MILSPLPDSQPIRILCGGTVRKTPDVLAASLASLDLQVLPPRVILTFAFVDDNVIGESSDLLREWVAARGGIYLDCRQADVGDFREGPQTHEWHATAMQRVGQLKNQLIRECLTGGYDALWLLDTDIVCGPRTFWSLWYTDAPIVCGVFWTRWQNTPECPPLPQVWLRHPYQLDGRGLDQPTFLHKLMERQRVQVWGQGACTLYRRAVLEKGVSFDYLPDLPKEGLWAGEDRHLCSRAERLHVPMVADGWPDLYHCYHEQQRAQLASVPDRLNHLPEGSPVTDDLISCTVTPLEPVPVNNQMVQLGPSHIRGQLGRLTLVPELESALRGMTRGAQQIVSVQYPHWSPSPFRGQRRLMDVHLIDWRHFAAPVET